MKRIIPLILAVALFMEQMDSTVIATSLPAIAQDIGVSPIALKLALTSYLVALAIFIPVSGYLADRFGAKQIFTIAIVVFLAGSIACVWANSLLWFVGARFLQGMGGALMTPVARLVLLRTTKKADLIGAMAWLTIPALMGPLVGPPLGGFITTYFSWHWIFLINIPIGLLGIAAIWRYLPNLEIHETEKLDWKGLVLSGAAASGLIFGLSVTSLPALPPYIGLLSMITGVISAIAYVRHAKSNTAPLLRISTLADDVFRKTVIAGSLFRVGIGATPFLLPLMLQLGFGLDAFQSGLIALAGAAGAISMKFLAQNTFAKFGLRNVLIICALFGGASLMLTGPALRDHSFVLLGLLLFGGGLLRSLFFTGLNALSFSEIASVDMAHATALSAVAQQLSVATGVAVAGGILEYATYVSGSALTVFDFSLAFVLIGLTALLAFLPFLSMAPDTGHEVSGHRRS